MQFFVVFAVVPFLKDIFSRMLAMLGMAKQDNMKWVFAHCELSFMINVICYELILSSVMIFNVLRSYTNLVYIFSHRAHSIALLRICHSCRWVFVEKSLNMGMSYHEDGSTLS